MTVKELIEKLQKYDPNMLVVVDTETGGLEEPNIYGVLSAVETVKIDGVQRYVEVDNEHNHINVLLIH